MARRILIVDDEPEMRELLREGLRIAASTWTSPKATTRPWSASTAERCDAVVTDIKMRGRSGIELCAWLRANRPDVPVIVITGFGTLDTAIAAIRAGAYDFLAKPFEVEELDYRARPRAAPPEPARGGEAPARRVAATRATAS